MLLFYSSALMEAGVRTFQPPGKVLIGPGQGFELCLHLGFQGEKLGLVAALAFFGEGLEGLSLALVGLLAEGVTLLEDPDIELELLLALVLATLEPAS
jgi:hypothetical protein